MLQAIKPCPSFLTCSSNHKHLYKNQNRFFMKTFILTNNYKGEICLHLPLQQKRVNLYHIKWTTLANQKRAKIRKSRIDNGDNMIIARFNGLDEIYISATRRTLSATGFTVTILPNRYLLGNMLYSLITLQVRASPWNSTTKFALLECIPILLRSGALEYLLFKQLRKNLSALCNTLVFPKRHKYRYFLILIKLD